MTVAFDDLRIRYQVPSALSTQPLATPASGGGSGGPSWVTLYSSGFESSDSFLRQAQDRPRQHGGHGLRRRRQGRRVALLRSIPERSGVDEAWGETRYAWGDTPTSLRYTGQQKVDLLLGGRRFFVTYILPQKGVLGQYLVVKVSTCF